MLFYPGHGLRPLRFFLLPHHRGAVTVPDRPPFIVRPEGRIVSAVKELQDRPDTLSPAELKLVPRLSRQDGSIIEGKHLNDFNGSPSSDSRHQPPGYTRTNRRQCYDPQSNVITTFSHYPATAIDVGQIEQPTEPQDLDPRLHGMWCWKRTVTMGQSSSPNPRQNSTYERSSRAILAPRDLGK